MSESAPDLRRRLPAVDRLLSEPQIERLTSLYGRVLVRREVRLGLEALRNRIQRADGWDDDQITDEVQRMIDLVEERLKSTVGLEITRVLNCTGIFLHTNLGRAPLPRHIARSLPPLLDAYCDLEFDLETGRRSERNRRVEILMRELTGAEGALIANNNAAVRVLALATLANDSEVVVSRGELVEIGGSFRIPDILEASGCRLVEVGATNRTRLSDYEQAIGPRTALLLKVHPSNYQMSGFVESVDASALAELGGKTGTPVLMDEGSGLLRPHRAPQLAKHPSIQELIASGCDLVCGSGDKVLGGPQAGILVGCSELIERCRKNPLYRALRPDRTVFAALESVLRIHLADGRMPIDGLWDDTGDLSSRLERAAAAISAKIVTAQAYIGGGAAPEQPIAGQALALPGSSSLLKTLRAGQPPVVGYIREGQLILDLRTVDPEDDDLLIAAVLDACSRN